MSARSSESTGPIVQGCLAEAGRGQEVNFMVNKKTKIMAITILDTGEETRLSYAIHSELGFLARLSCALQHYMSVRFDGFAVISLF